MMVNTSKITLSLAVALLSILLSSGCINSEKQTVLPEKNMSSPASQEWTLVNPEGAYKIEPVEILFGGANKLDFIKIFRDIAGRKGVLFYHGP